MGVDTNEVHGGVWKERGRGQSEVVAAATDTPTPALAEFRSPVAHSVEGFTVVLARFEFRVSGLGFWSFEFRVLDSGVWGFGASGGTFRV